MFGVVVCVSVFEVHAFWQSRNPWDMKEMKYALQYGWIGVMSSFYTMLSVFGLKQYLPKCVDFDMYFKKYHVMRCLMCPCCL